MLLQYLKITVRVFLKNKLFTAINILGLSIGIAAYILITQYVNFESEYDQHQEGVENLYRITLTSNLGEKDFVTLATNHPAVGFAMKQDFPEVESFARFMEKTIMWGSFVLSHTNENGTVVKTNVVDEKLYLADNAALNLFDVKLIKGSKETALIEPSSIVLSAKTAQQFFGDQDPIGKTLRRDNNINPLIVTGVFEELPENTHLKFNMLVSFSTLGTWTNETWIWPDFYNYVRLKPGTDPIALEAKLPAFAKKYLSDIMQEHGFQAQFKLQPISDIHLKSNYINEAEANANAQTLGFLRMIAFFVILIALMNFINLSTAKSTERAMEVGLKKVAGVKKSELVGQFLFESLAINFMATLVAVVLITLLMHPFNDLVGLTILTPTMWLDPQIWIHLLTVLFLGGLLAGAYPAFVLSSFKPITVLKGKFHQSGKGTFIRKALVIAQFSISIALIAGTFIVYGQFSFMQNQELGYDVEHNLVVTAPTVIDSTNANKIEVFKDELKENPKVNAVTVSNEIPGRKIPWDQMVRQVHEQPEAGVNCDFLNIDSDFLETYKIKLITGRNFREEDRTSYGSYEEGDVGKTHRVIINKAAVKVLGFSSPTEALNKKITFQMFGPNDRTAEVIGVVDNYHQQSLKTDYYPTVFLNPNFYDARYLTININTSDLQNTIMDIGKKFDSFYPKDPFDHFFLEDHFNKQYKADLKFGEICMIFAGLAIFIAIIGLFGLGSYIALKKTKELCVRKVLGANLLQVLILIPKGLIILVLLSGLIALPITYFLAEEWLSDYAFRIALNVWMFVIPFSLVLIIAALSVLPESIKVATLNPSKYLRNE